MATLYFGGRLLLGQHIRQSSSSLARTASQHPKQQLHHHARRQPFHRPNGRLLRNSYEPAVSPVREAILMQHRLNQTLASVQHNLRLYLASLRGQKLRQFRALYRQLTSDFRLWAKGEGDKVPEGFGKFYPKGKAKEQPAQQKGTASPHPAKPINDASKPREIEFKFSFGSGKTGGGGGGPGKPLDPNMWTMLGFFGTMAVLMGFTFFKIR